MNTLNTIRTNKTNLSLKEQEHVMKQNTWTNGFSNMSEQTKSFYRKSLLMSCLLGLSLSTAQISAADIAIENAGFETPVLADGGSSATAAGWTGAPSGVIVNPTNNINAYGENVYRATGVTSLSQSVGSLVDGVYTLSVEIGARPAAAFGTYSLVLGVLDGTNTFVPLATDANTVAPIATGTTLEERFETASLTYDSTGSANLGDTLVVRLLSDTGEINFDNVSLSMIPNPGNVAVYIQAQEFNKTLPDGTEVPMWGYALCSDSTYSDCTLPADMDAPGPVIEAYAGFGLDVHLKNTLATPVSIHVPGQASGGNGVKVSIPTNINRVGSFAAEVASGSELTYTWPNLKSGTYLYQSGSYPSLQVPMGLYGALIVRENATSAYPAISGYDTESMVLFSEIDALQNKRVSEAATAGVALTPSCTQKADYLANMVPGYPCTIDYNPKYLLVNGSATSDFNVAQNANVLFRFLNAGLRSHTPAFAGLDIDIIAEDGNLYPGLPRKQSALLLAAGKTRDALAVMPNSDISFSMFERMPSFRNDSLKNLDAGQQNNSSSSVASLGGVVVGAGSATIVEPPSVVTDDKYSVVEDTQLNVTAPGVLGNDSVTPVALAVAQPPSHGSVALSLDGSFIYTPDPDYSGSDQFTYDADGNIAFVTLAVSYENDAPVAVADGPFVNAVGTSISSSAPGVLANDIDADGDVLTAVPVGTLPSNLTFNPDGSFEYTGVALTTFSYQACDTDNVCSAPVDVSLSALTPSGINLSVVDETNTALTDYRWTVEENAHFHPDPANPSNESLANNFHKSYMPVVAQGVGAIEFADLALDPAKHYHVSVLPMDAAAVDGHSIGSSDIPPGATDVTVRVNSTPTPTAQISMFVFNDNYPTNGAVDGPEIGLGGFQVTLEDAGGRYGASAGLLSQDVFGNPLTNSLDCFGGELPAQGIILSCPDTAENRAAGTVGEVLVKNLFPGKYGVIVTPPSSQSTDWIQTSTIEGTKVIDAWVKANEPAFFQEFGPAGYHVFVGFVNPIELEAAAPIGDKTVTGMVSNMHLSRPPIQTLWDSGSYDALAHTRAWVGLNSANGNGQNYRAQEVAEDGTFTFSNIPAGDYQLVIWDKYLDIVIGYRSFSLTDGMANIELGTTPVFQWFTRLENTVFLDDGCVTTGGGGTALDGIRQPCEGAVPEQNVNLRWRDGTINQAMPTDTEGFVPFDQTFPFFHWQVAEVDFARLKATGVTVTVDGGGDVTSTGNILNPQVQADGTSTTRTETGPVLTQGFQGFLGQTSQLEWGKAPYNEGENGGISGIVYYASTRAENDPRLGVAEVWEPGVPGATVRLYRTLTKKPEALVINNAGFEAQAPGAVVDWVETGTGSVVDPSVNINAYDVNVYRSTGGTLTQTLSDTLEPGEYTLSVEVGGRPFTPFGTYKVQLGVYDIFGQFIVLSEDNNSKLPNENGTTLEERFETATVTFNARDNNEYLGANLAVRLIATSEVNFDNVQLITNLSGLALVAETETDSWDKSVPEGCPGEDATDIDITNTLEKCYDGLRNFNQIRPGVFDGGYAFMDIPAGDYVVEVVPPMGYEIVKEQDVNVGFGESYSVAPASVVLPTGGTYEFPDYATVEAALKPGLAQPQCVGDDHIVPAVLSLLPGENVEAPFAGAARAKCDRKLVHLPDQGNAAADFFVFTGAPIAAHFVGMILDDTAQEFDPKSPAFGEKWAPPFVPVSIRDYTGTEVGRVYSDQWGRMNGLLQSTFTANMPSPSGYSPSMMITCMNDPGPIDDPANPGNKIIDPQYNPAYKNFCYTFQYMPGTTTYLDTPVVPVSAFASGYNPPDCDLPAGTPKIQMVNGSEAIAGVETSGPLVVPNGMLNIYSMGLTTVNNPDYEGPLGTTPKTITRDFGFGTDEGTVTLNGTLLSVLNWSDNKITVAAPATQQVGDLVVTNSAGVATENGITVTVWDVENRAGLANRVIRVPEDFASIQDAVDAANVNNLILVAPGTYDERIIMYKPVRIQGSGAGSTFVNAVKRPAEVMDVWHAKMDCLYGIGAGCTKVVDSVPNQPDGAVGFLKEEGAAFTVVAPFDPRTGTRPANRFLGRQAQIDGFSITGGDTGGGVFVNGYAHRLQLSNNVIFGNHGSYHGGIRVGHPFLKLDTDGPYGLNERINIHNNVVALNGALDGAGAGISLSAGTDRYTVQGNYVCGNFTIGDGGGIGHLGFSQNGRILDNTILLNQSFDQGRTRSGGGIFIGGEVTVNDFNQGSGTVTIMDNVIQSNYAASGHGGGIRTQFVNGVDIMNNLTQRGRWNRINIQNNIIVNNVAGWSGAGVSLQDTVIATVRNNTIANNDSTATVGPIVNVNISQNQPAGLATEVYSPELAALLATTNAPARLKTFSNPAIQNNILWHNRSFNYDSQDGTAKLVPELTQTAVGDCDANANYWDLGVLGNAGTLNPRFSVLSDITGYHSSNKAGDPAFVSPFCNGGRSGPGPMVPIPALDEGGATWIDVRFGPLKLLGDYHIQGTSSALDSATNAGPAADIDGDTRPDTGLNDIGADELVPQPAPGP